MVHGVPSPTPAPINARILMGDLPDGVASSSQAGIRKEEEAERRAMAGCPSGRSIEGSYSSAFVGRWDPETIQQGPRHRLLVLVEGQGTI
ncbi:GL22572 [Drosophila persimilis]|uniref:GL22572 n=1 Tax=Drosophila persimilis TaxID=7234 RepID=B4H198_DROPE|nr:GL22572 [Drosophila persimilis]